MQMLETKSRSSERTTSALNCGAISSAPNLSIFLRVVPVTLGKGSSPSDLRVFSLAFSKLRPCPVHVSLPPSEGGFPQSLCRGKHAWQVSSGLLVLSLRWHRWHRGSMLGRCHQASCRDSRKRRRLSPIASWHRRGIFMAQDCGLLLVDATRWDSPPFQARGLVSGLPSDWLPRPGLSLFT